MTAPPVAPVAAIRLTLVVLARQLVTTGRLAALSLLGLGVVVDRVAVGRSSPDEPLRTGVEIIVNLGFTVVVPIVALPRRCLVGRHARTGRWCISARPMQRWPVVVGAWLAALAISLPLTVVPMTISAAPLDGGAELVLATLVASSVAVLAYSALFVLLGLFVKNPIVWGLGYVILWEASLPVVGTVAARLAVRGYARSILTAWTGVHSSSPTSRSPVLRCR
ncbi:MAG: hypothetical protein R2695_08040 [Acidimicrobiales bacterium]